MSESPTRWYGDGLRFECTQCGNCCSGPPGHVWVTPEDVVNISRFLGRSDDKLGAEHVRRVGLRHSLTEKKGGDCIFLKRANGKAMCTIYPVRPAQCRTWPFWSSNLRTREAWDQTAGHCPGMNHGRTYSFVAVEELRLKKPNL